MLTLALTFTNNSNEYNYNIYEFNITILYYDKNSKFKIDMNYS